MDDDLITIDVLEALNTERVLKLSELGDSVEMVQFDSVNPDAFFSNPRSLVVGKNYILISDDQTDKVYLFDRIGKLIRLIGRVGKGPGEFIQAWVAGMDPGEKFIFVVDDMQRKLIKYDINGLFIKEISTKDLIPGWFCDGMDFQDDNHFALIVRYPMKECDLNSRVMVFDLDLNLARRFRSSADKEFQVLPYLISASLRNAGDRLIFWETGFDTLWYFYPDGREIPAYHFKISNNPVSLEYLREMRKPGEETPDFNRIYGVVETANYLLITGQAGAVFNLAYDKKNRKVFALANPELCDTSRSRRPSIENDLFGIEPVSFMRVDFSQKLLVMGGRPDWFRKSNNISCVKKKKVKYPEILDEYLQIAEKASFEDFVLFLIRMK